MKTAIIAIISIMVLAGVAYTEHGMVVFQDSAYSAIPQYQLWNGTGWSSANNASSVGDAIRW